MATYGLADDGTRNFVDLNSLPLEAVDRIEVLKDGASAIYGADAVGGVVNIILRKTYAGFDSWRHLRPDARRRRRDVARPLAYGFGNLATDKYNVFFNMEAAKTKNIWSTDRGFIGNSDLTSYGYYDLTNGANRPYLLAGPTSNSPYGMTRNDAGGGRPGEHDSLQSRAH